MHTLALLLLACAPAPEDPDASTPTDPVTSPTADTAGPGSTADTAADDTSQTGGTASTGSTAHTGLTLGPCSDAYDPNDTPADAVELVSGAALRTSEDQPDYWTVTLASGASSLLESTTADVQLEVTGEDGELQRYGRSVLRLSNSSATPQAFIVRAVRVSYPSCIDYEVTRTDSSGAEVCPPDEVGDDWTSATPLTASPYSNNYWLGDDHAASYDPDWYSVELRAGSYPTVQVYGADDGVKVDVFRDPTQDPVLSWWGGYSYDYVVLESQNPVQADDTYYVRVERTGGYPGCPHLEVSVY
jgi:hypothetical protein